MHQLKIAMVAISAFMLLGANTSAQSLPDAQAFMKGFCPAGDKKSECDYNLETFPQDYAGAVAGDYQGQRNVAFCLSNGCAGAVDQRPALACAWRKVILASAHFGIGESDFMSHRNDCGSLEGTRHAVAVSQAREILSIVAPDKSFPASLIFVPD